MADVGEDVTLDIAFVDADGNAVDPESVDFALTDPDGAVTNPAPTNPDPGSYRAVWNASVDGRWTWTWSTTTPAFVEHGYTDATDVPTLWPLATIKDLEARIGPLTPAQAARAPALLDDASGEVRSFTHQDFDAVVGDVQVLRSAGKIVRLPQRPVNAVSQVVAVGVPPVADLVLPVGTWAWDGIDKIELSPRLDWVVNLPEVWTEGWEGTGSFRVTYSHGGVTPKLVKRIVTSMVTRVLTAPSPVEGMVAETIGQASYQMQQSTGSAGSGVRLMPSEEKVLAKAGFVRTAGTSETPVR